MALVVGGLAPATWLGLRDRPLERLIGLQLAGAVLVPVLLLLSYAYGQTSYLIVPLVLAVLSFAGGARVPAAAGAVAMIAGILVAGMVLASATGRVVAARDGR